MGTGSQVGQVHEVKQALGFTPVGWESVLDTPASVYTQEDKDIAQFFERPYWKYVYQDSATWVDANCIVENINDIIEQAEQQINKSTLKPDRSSSSRPVRFGNNN
jgi:hypothetical protein